MQRWILLLAVLCFTRVAAAQPEYTAYTQALIKAIEFKDEKLMDKNLRQYSRSAVTHFYVLLREWRFGRTEVSKEARATIDHVMSAWKRVFNTTTLEKVERYYSGVDGTAIRQLDTAGVQFEKMDRDLAAARGTKSRDELQAARETAWKLAGLYEGVGHNLFAADCWEKAAVAIYAMPEITLGERRDCVFALERYKELRESWEFTEEDQFKANMAFLKDQKSQLDATEKAAKDREARGVSGDARGPDAVVDPKAAEIVADLHFEAMKSEIEDCFIQGGSVMPNWQVMELKEETPSQLLFFKGAALYGVRLGGNKFFMSPSADPQALKGAFAVSPSPRPKPSMFWLDAEKTKPYAMWLFVGGDKEPFMGLEMNLAADAKRALVYYKSAASWKASIAGEEVTFYDSNCDGRLFEPDAYKFGLEDPTIVPGQRIAVPGYDSMQVGKRGSVQPFSGYAKIGDGWFHLREAKEGKAVSARAVIPAFFATGTLQLKWTGPRSTKVQALIVRGEGDLAVAAFNLAAGKPVEVPAGSYSIDYGRIAEGKGSNWMTADIFKGKSEVIKVAAGEAKVLTIGAPFMVDFEKGTSGANIELNAHKLTLFGAANEQYVHLNGCVPELDVFFAKDDKGRGARPMGTFVPVDSAEIAAKLNTEFPDLGYWAPMFPVVKGAKDRVNLLVFTPPGEGFVGMRAVKPKLFGKIDSAWK